MINNFTLYNNGYEVLIVGLSASFIAQVVKFLLNWAIKRKPDFKYLTTTGGMPSSHTAAVIGLSCTIGFICGFSSVEFAIAAGYAIVVMQDATGIRRASGRMATCLNKIMYDFYKHDVQSAGDKLKEMLGHTPYEVFVGAIFGLLFAYYMHYCFMPHFFAG